MAENGSAIWDCPSRTGICDPSDEVLDDEGGEAEGEGVDGGVAHAEVGGHAGDVHRLDARLGQGHVQA